MHAQQHKAGSRSGRATTAPAGRTQLRGSRIAASSQPSSSSTAWSWIPSSRRRTRVERSAAARPARARARAADRRRRSSCALSQGESLLELLDRAMDQHLRRAIVRPRARAISRLSMPSEKRMISASRRSSAAASRLRGRGRARRDWSRDPRSSGAQAASPSPRAGLRAPRPAAVVVRGEVVCDPDQPWP